MTQATGSNHAVRQGIAAGTSMGAAVIGLTVGALSLLQGISAVADDKLFIVTPDYIYDYDTTAWGWVHIVLGIFLAAAAIGLIMGAAWARVAVIVIAALSIVGNFLSLPYYPWWSILVIALDVVVIWAVTTWDPQTT